MDPTTTGPLHLTASRTPSPPSLAGRGRGWADPPLINQTPAERRRELAGAWLLLVVVTAVDLVLIKSTLDHVLRLAEGWSWLTAIGLTVAAVALAYNAGTQTRAAQATGTTPTRTAVIASVALVWLAVGVGLFWLRWNATAFTPTAVLYDTTGAADATADRADQTEKLLAVVLGTIYAATGALAWLDGHKLTNHAATALRRARDRLDRINPLLADKTARVSQLAENRTIHTHDLDLIEAHRRNAAAAHRALAAELKEHARVQIALNLGDPEATGLTQNRPEDT